MRPALLLPLCFACLSACKDKAADSGSGGGGSATDGCSDSAYGDSDLCTGWLLNTEGETAAVIRSDDGTAPLVHVQAVEVVQDGGVDFVRVQTTGLPDYSVVLSGEQVATLQGRPKASTDFRSGAPTVAAGDRVEFGQDIGYDSTGCADDEGEGYWPPGPECPEDAGVEAWFPAVPEPATETCWTQLNHAGLFLNGVALFNWYDGQSYDGDDVWHNNAPILEQYDGDVCSGHAAGVTYHHHSRSSCLEDRLGDDGSGHSPVLGFAADGYPIHGPWQAAGQEAQSCWAPRDYDDPAGAGSCGAAGQRTCLLVDPHDLAAGVTDAPDAGPDTTETLTSLSGNTFTAVSGVYFEDYYFDASCAAAGGAFLDAHNGHDHDDLGYHYHFTATFPFTAGPTFYGKLHDNSLATCGSDPAGQAGGGGGPGGGADGGGMGGGGM